MNSDDKVNSFIKFSVNTLEYTFGFVPVLARGITIDPNNPLHFSFVVSSGDTQFTDQELKVIHQQSSGGMNKRQKLNNESSNSKIFSGNRQFNF